MNAKELKVLQEAAEGATQGEWSRTSSGDQHWLREVRGDHGAGIAWCGSTHVQQALADAYYIATANPAVVLRLLAHSGADGTGGGAGRAAERCKTSSGVLDSADALGYS